MKNKFFLFCFLVCSFFLLPVTLLAQTETGLIRVGDKIVQLEFNTTDVDIEISPYDEKFISYKIEGNEKKKIFKIENEKKLQFYTCARTNGKIFVYVPKKFLFESCRIQAVRSKVQVRNIKSIYFVLSCSATEIDVANSKFKNLLLATNLSSVKFSSGVVAVADFCLNSSKGIIEIAEEMKNCDIFMTQLRNKSLLFNGKPYDKASFSSTGTTNEKAKKHISISSSLSDININFVKPLTNLTEEFDEYGISEFGPRPAPNLGDPVSNFLPKDKN